MRAAVGELLRSEGFDVVEAADGLEALLQVKRTRPAGVVLDLVMPRLGGLEAIKRIRAFDRGTRMAVSRGGRAQDRPPQPRRPRAVPGPPNPPPPAERA